MTIFLITAFVLILIALFVFRRLGGFGFPWVQFYVNGKESGFTFGELNLLRRVAVDNKLKNPTSLFWSERTLDRCIRSTIVRQRARGQEENEHSVEFLSKLYDFRKQVEFNQPKYRLGLRSSRNISQGQIMKLTVPGTSGAFTCKVVENMRKYLAVSYPEGPKLPPGYSWQGQRVNIYFWRKEDAGYYFESRVIGDYLERKYPILHIAHADKIVRTQKRSSVRAELKTKGTLFPLRSIQQANETIENSGGYRCRMVDISEDGAAIMVGGKAKPGLPVKLQTQINGKNIVLSGTVKGVTYRSKPHVSILHIEAQEPSKVIRNTILTYVYNIFRDETGDSPKAVRKGSAAPRAGGTTKASGNGEAYAASGTTQGEADSQEADA